MGFAGGSVSFKRFIIQGTAPREVGESLIEKAAARAISADPIQTADRTEIGWTTGQHILDTKFTLGKNAIADGLHLALRVDTNKPPGDLVRSYQRINEEAMLETSGRAFLSKAERREAREQAISRADSEARAGRYRRMRQVPVFWDLKRNEVYLGGTSPTLSDQFMLLFQQTFDCAAIPATSGEIAGRWASLTGAAQEFDHAQPAHFVSPPDGAGDAAELGSAEQQTRDYLGTEWLTWLWYTSHVESPEITTGLGESMPVLFEKSLQLECAFRMTGTVAIQSDGPTQLPEAPVALAGGKRPVRAGLQLALHGDVFGLTIRGDMMHYTGVQLPAPETGSEPRAIFEDRIEHLRDLIEGVNELYIAFLKKRLSGRWSQTLNAMRSWVAGGRYTESRTEGRELPEPVSAAS